MNTNHSDMPHWNEFIRQTLGDKYKEPTPPQEDIQEGGANGKETQPLQAKDV